MFRVLSLLFLLILFFSATGLAAPQFVVDRQGYDFGEIVQGDFVEYVFRIHNAGDEILELGKVQTSCGCTVGKLSSGRIAPGDSVELWTKFDSSRFKGGVKKTISLETNDPLKRQVFFTLSGEIKVELLVTPEQISWGQVTAVQELDRLVTISNQAPITVNLQPPQTTNPALRAVLSSQEIKPGGQVELRVHGQLGPDIARLSGYVIVSTDYPKVPQIRVPVSARLAN